VVSIAKFLKGMYEATLENPGERVGAHQIAILGGDMDNL